jgi:hypothetical protein
MPLVLTCRHYLYGQWAEGSLQAANSGRWICRGEGTRLPVYVQRVAALSFDNIQVE